MGVRAAFLHSPRVLLPLLHVPPTQDRYSRFTAPTHALTHSFLAWPVHLHWDRTTRTRTTAHAHALQIFSFLFSLGKKGWEKDW